MNNLKVSLEINEAEEVINKDALNWLIEHYGYDKVIKNKNPTVFAFNKILEITQNGSIPWNDNQFGKGEELASKKYSMFPITDDLLWEAYCAQETMIWSAKELPFNKDKEEYTKIPKRYQELYCDLLAFFSPGDGLITKQVMRYLKECKTYSEMMFFITQIFIELVHAESYGMSIVSVLPSEIEQQKVFEEVDKLDCVKAKADFILKYESSTYSKGFRYVVGAVTEGIFFVSLFAVVFYLRKKGIMKTFTFLNEQVSKDETLHRDVNILLALRYGNFKEEEISEIITMIKSAVEIEMNHLQYILRKPVDSIEADTSSGLSIKELRNFVQSLADQIMGMLELPVIYNSESNLPWLNDLALSRKSNFYEEKVGSYKKISLKTAIDWKERAGLNEENKINSVANPLDVDF